MQNNICVVGLGLIGGSLGMAIKKKKLGRVFGLTRDKIKGQLAIKLKAVDYASTNIKGLVEDSNIIIICYPMHLIVPEIQKILQFVKPGTIITDVGSSKSEIVKQAEKLMPKGVFYVGGHPMAGKEISGLEAAEADLLNGCNYFLTKTAKTNPQALNTLKTLLTKLGVKIHVVDPAEHDEMVAGISHMPVAIAASLVDSVMNAGKFTDKMKQFAAAGFKDATRIASGDPELGTDMFISNKKAVLGAIKRFKISLSLLEWAIRFSNAEAIKEKLSKIKSFRDSIYK